MTQSADVKPIILFVYETSDGFRGVCLPYFISISRDTFDEARYGIEGRTRDFFNTMYSNDIDPDTMIQLPRQRKDAEIATKVLEDFSEEIKKLLSKHLESHINNEKAIRAEKKPLWNAKFNREDLYSKQSWSRKGFASKGNKLCGV